MSVSALISNIARGSLHDGPGVRTVVYFKGCGLRCQWCHNPETWSVGRQILYAASKCIHCGKCIEACPEHHEIRGEEMLFFRDGCMGCGKCAAICPSLALSLCGEEKTAKEVFEEIQKDAHYYACSGGGVTFSGGECLLQSQFVAEIGQKCKEMGIHTAVESAFFVPWDHVETVLPVVDLFFADLKIPDPEKHRCFTGQDNRRIVDNIRRLSETAEQVILRIPVIPGVNDGDEDLEGFGALIKTFGKGVTGVELLKYNNLAQSKYTGCGMEYVKFGEEPQSDEEMKRLCGILEEKCGRNCFFV